MPVVLCLPAFSEPSSGRPTPTRFVNGPGDLEVDFSGYADLSAFRVEGQAPGVLREDRDSFINPRAALLFDVFVGDHLYFFTRAEADRGIDPGATPPEFRIDECFGRYTQSGETWSASAQIGKFGTPLGNFVPRHEPMKNALVRAPMVYDRVTGIGDARPVGGNQALIDRRDLDDKKDKWVTMIWGPVYHTGAMLFGNAGKFDARVAVTNSAPSERPEEWDWRSGDGQDLAVSGRIGVEPLLGFRMGLDYARGPYLRNRISPFLRPGTARKDYVQELAGMDFEYRVGKFALISEVYESGWEVPNVSGTPRAIGYYVEGKFTVVPRFFVAARWNQMCFNEIRDAGGGRTPWDRWGWRIETGGGYFVREDLLFKMEYEFNWNAGPNDPRDNMLSMSLTKAF